VSAKILKMSPPESPHRRGARKRSKQHCGYCGTKLLKDESDAHTEACSRKHKGHAHYLLASLAEFLATPSEQGEGGRDDG
jgi:hypothetical protein